MSILFTITAKSDDRMPKQKMKIIADSREEMLNKMAKHFTSRKCPHWHFCHYEDICLATESDLQNESILK